MSKHKPEINEWVQAEFDGDLIESDRENLSRVLEMDENAADDYGFLSQLDQVYQNTEAPELSIDFTAKVMTAIEKDQSSLLIESKRMRILSIAAAILIAIIGGIWYKPIMPFSIESVSSLDVQTVGQNAIAEAKLHAMAVSESFQAATSIITPEEVFSILPSLTYVLAGLTIALLGWGFMQFAMVRSMREYI